mgnify:CR=1 FL=1
MATLQNFLDIHEIPYLRFDGKKKGASLPTGWDKLSYEKSMKLNKNRKGKYMNVNWKGSKYFVVDIDKQGDWWKETYPDTVMTKSTGKGLPHLIYEKNDNDDFDGNNTPMDGGDLCYKNSFEHWDAKLDYEHPTKLDFVPKGKKEIVVENSSPISVKERKEQPKKEQRYLSQKVREDVENLLDIIKNPDLGWQDWFNIIIAIRNTHPSLKNEAKEWSERSSKHIDDTFEGAWTTGSTLSGLGMWTLKTKAMAVNKSAFLKWKNKKLDMTPEYFCDMFMEQFGNDNLVYTDDKRLFIFINGNWYEDSDRLKLKKTIRKITQNDLRKQKKDYEDNDPMNSNYVRIIDQLEKIQKRSLVDDIATFISQNLDEATCNLEESIKFDVGKEQIYNLHFKNGVLELDRDGCSWRDRTYEDYITVGSSVNNWEFNPFERDEELIDEVENDFKKVQPDDTQRKFMLEWLAYGLTGDTSRTKCKFNIGLRASNGKTTEFLIHAKCFPKLIMNVPRKYFNEDFTKRHKTKIHLLTKPIRIAYIEEIDEKQLEASELKDAVDGKKQNCEIMYGTQTEGSFSCKWNFLGQREPNIKEDAGVLRRGIMQQYTSKFAEGITEDDWDNNVFPRIKDFENKYDDDAYKNAYLHLLLDNYKGSSFHIPSENTESFINYIQEINGDRDLVDLTEEGKADDWVSKASLCSLLKKNPSSLKAFIKEFYPNSIYDKSKRVDGQRGAYNKIKIKNE